MKEVNFLKDKTILITGGTGSFGKKFIKFLLANTEAKKIIVFSRDELKQHEMGLEIQDERLRFFLGDIRDLSRLRRAFNGVDIIIHAAALKQVPTLEYNPFEAVKTNILGTENIINAAIDNDVEKVLLISTDKSVQPINLYGSTKLCAEKLFVAGNFYSGRKTKFSAVRYGNVIGSRGSLIETLLKDKETQEVSVTDDKMTRFWLAFAKSFELVMFALENMVGGEIFIPKNIPAMKLVDTFNALVPNAKKKIIGIRPGEKRHEILLTEEESRRSVDYKDYFVILPDRYPTISMDKFEKYTQDGKKLPGDFSLRSDTTKNILSAGELLKIIKEEHDTIR